MVAMGALSIGRRAFIQASGGTLVSSGIIGTAHAVSEEGDVILSGSVNSHEGNPMSGWQVFVASRDGPSQYIELDDTGTFSASIKPDSKYYLAFYKSPDGGYPAPVRSSVPHIDGLGDVSVGSRNVDIGTKTLPKAYPVDIRALDGGGEPAPSAEIHFYSDGFGPGYWKTFVNEAGYYQVRESDFTGVDLAGSIQVEVSFDDEEYSTNSYVDGPMTIVARSGQGITFKEDQLPEETSTVTHTTTKSTRTTTKIKSPSTSQQLTSSPTPTNDVATTTRTSGQATEGKSDEIRGFFTNGSSAEEFSFLSNPLHLTVAGFILSVFGVILELLRGK